MRSWDLQNWDWKIEKRAKQFKGEGETSLQDVGPRKLGDMKRP